MTKGGAQATTWITLANRFKFAREESSVKRKGVHDEKVQSIMFPGGIGVRIQHRTVLGTPRGSASTCIVCRMLHAISVRAGESLLLSVWMLLQRRVQVHLLLADTGNQSKRGRSSWDGSVVFVR
jgi:hypothetical protein